MPRIGMNPNRGRTTDYRPARITLAMLTYLPNEDGYFKNRFEVMRLSLESLIAHTTPPYDLMVFDNGSSSRWVDYLKGLHEMGNIHYLLLSSRNVGKISAMQVIFRAAPGELVAYSDDDILFLPGWLEAHLDILTGFPKVGMVTGFYLRDHTVYGMNSTLEYAQSSDAKVERGLFLERKWEQHFIENMGRTWDKYLEETRGVEDIVFTCNGVQAYASAGHHQFVARKDLIESVLPKQWEGHLMGKMRELDEAVDRLGYLRLSTRQPVTRLLGNTISEENAKTARAYEINANSSASLHPEGISRRIYRLGPVQWIARRLYNRLFDIVNS